MAFSGAEQTILLEQLGYPQRTRYISPAVAPLIWLGATYMPPANSYYAFLLTRISFGLILPDTFTYILNQRGLYGEQNIIGTDILRDGVPFFTAVTIANPLDFWIFNADRVAHRFDFTLEYIVIQTQPDMERIQRALEGLFTQPAAAFGSRGMFL